MKNDVWFEENSTKAHRQNRLHLDTVKNHSEIFINCKIIKTDVK
jgi:hypothetical protein